MLFLSYRRSDAFLIPFFFVAWLFFTLSFARAESIVWTNTSTTKICSPKFDSGGNTKVKTYIARYGGACTATRLTSRNVQITYNVVVRNITKGTTVPCDGAGVVTKGDELSLEFIPHQYTDIYWSGTGYSNDTPYGDWIGAAGPPDGSPHQCLPKDDVNGKIFAPLSVSPPTKSISGGGNLGCATLTDGKMSCTPSVVGTNTINFVFGATDARFYGRTITGANAKIAKLFGGTGQYCVGSNAPMQTYTTSGTDCAKHISSYKQFSECKFAKPTGTTYTLSVPQQTISCPITVKEKESNNVAPTMTNFHAAGACTAGTDYTLSMTGADSDGDKIRYRIDWDATADSPADADSIPDNDVNQEVPSGSFVASGTTLTASRIFTAGPKTVKVRAEDERGSISSPATLTFNCADPLPNAPTTPSISAARSCPAGTEATLIWVAYPTTGISEYHIERCTGDSCADFAEIATDAASPFTNAGISDNTTYRYRILSHNHAENIYSSPSAPITLRTCTSPGQGSHLPEAVLYIRANPSFVNPNGTTRIHWNATNVQSCRVSGNGNEWTDSEAPFESPPPFEEPEGGHQTNPITGPMVYTLSCVDLSGETQTRTTTITLNPNWLESPHPGESN